MNDRATIMRDESGIPARLEYHREGPSAAVATLQRKCNGPECGKTLTGRQRGFCSSHCRYARWEDQHPRMLLLPFEPPAEPLMPLGPTPVQIKASQKAQTKRVLGMLQVGPCTTGDFLRAGIGRFGARVGELRAVGHRIEMEKRGEHGALYRLERG